MKPLYLLALSTVISLGSVAQKNDEHKEKDKHEKESTHPKQNAHVMQHEKIIWAGTGLDLNDKSKDVKNIPDAVLNSFRQFFPTQEIDDVRKYRGLYAITYSNEVYTTTLIYKADGTLVEARTVATDSILPSIVKEKLKNAKKEYSHNEIVMIEKPDKEKFYRVHLKENQRDRFVVYDEEGREIKYDY